MNHPDLMRGIDRLLAPIRRRLAQTLVKGAMVLDIEDRPLRQVQAQLINEQLPYHCDHFEPYGFTSRALKGFTGLYGALMGNRSNTVLLANSDRRFRIRTLQPGEVAIYDDLGNVVKLGRTQVTVTAVTKLVATAPIATITATTKATVTTPELDVLSTLKVSIVAPEIDLVGAVAITGTATLNGVAMT